MRSEDVLLVVLIPVVCELNVRTLYQRHNRRFLEAGLCYGQGVKHKRIVVVTLGGHSIYSRKAVTYRREYRSSCHCNVRWGGCRYRLRHVSYNRWESVHRERQEVCPIGSEGCGLNPLVIGQYRSSPFFYYYIKRFIFVAVNIGYVAPLSGIVLSWQSNFTITLLTESIISRYNLCKLR